MFQPTFAGEGIIRSDDVLNDPRYGRNAPHKGMPAGHLPVRSYLAVPVISRTGKVIGGLFFGHPEPNRFAARHEQLMQGLAGQAAIAIDNATLYQELQRSNETLEQRVETATAERETALAQLHEAQKLETLGQLTGGVAHDFNNLLTPITGALDLLSRRVVEGDTRTARLIDNALQSAERAKTLVARLLGFARRVSLESRPVDLAELVDGMHDLIASSIGQSIELRISAAPDLPAALVDPNQLELAILNLCVNGRDAMLKGGTLIVAVEQALLGPRSVPGVAPGAYVRLSVIDTGTGMDAATLKRAVEPFFSTKELGRGTGLGLSMVHGLAAQLGGGFMLSSEPGEGTRVDLYLPAADRAALSRPPRSVDHADSQISPLAILLVDDEDLVRTATAEMLRDLGHDVVEAAGGAQALTRLGTGHFDVVLTDYMMPQMDGGELAQRIRQRHPSMPILIITGYSGGDLNLAVPHMAKPFRQHELAARLRSLTASSDRKVVPISGTRS
jgi:signal transduction histidine kinase